MTTTTTTATATTRSKTATATTRSKITAIQSEARDVLLERDDTFRAVILAALAGEHAVLIGPPGEAKSLLARTFAESLTGSVYFEWLLSKFSTPEELFGPLSISGLKADRFTRVTTGKLPEAHVAFLDEVFKANSAILNALLAALNERVFHDGAGAKAMPLVTVVAASNELPDGAELNALWDRFLVRAYVRPLADPSSFLTVFTGKSKAKCTTTVSLAEWDEARAEVAKMPIPASVGQSTLRLRDALSKDGIEHSTRRWRKCASILRAAAWLDGSTEVCDEHLTALSACLWNTPEQEPVVLKHVSQFAAQDVASATRLFDGAIALITGLPADTDPAFSGRAVTAHKEVKKALVRLTELRDGAKSPTGRAKIDGLTTQLAERSQTLLNAVTKSLGL